MRLEPALERRIGAGVAQRLGVGVVGIKIDGFAGNHRRLGRQRAGLLERCRQFAGLDLAGFDVGLIERIDADDRAGDRGRDLEAEKFLADIVRAIPARCGPPDDRPLSSASSLASSSGIFVACERKLDEETIVAVNLRHAERLAVDRDETLAVLAGRFGEQLLGPGAEIGEAGRRQDRDLVAARPRGGAEREAEHDTGILRRRHVGAARMHHHARRLHPAPQCRCRRWPPAPDRTATAPSSGRRCWARRRISCESFAPWPIAPAPSPDR